LINHRYLVAIAAALFLFSTHAGAFELGKIDVVSHLGERFHAEVPLTLDEGEEISKLSVELASPDDYRTLKVHRDPALSLIRTDVTGGNRGGRIKLTSRNLISAPFIMVVLKARYGHATHYQKYPVFLDISRADQPLKRKAPFPTVSVNDLKQEPPALPRGDDSEGEGSETEEKVTVEVSPPFKPFDSWARTSRYGPVVYGDTIFTIADRLRIDKRYTIRQVMVALFEKNRAQFVEENLNLAMHGSYLDVPTAEEVERLSYEQALSIIEEHDQRWKELMKQPRYAAIAEAQKTRYSKRMRVAEDIKAARAASGMAATPVSDQ
jgi:pilus assembly protein FimV